MVVYMFVCTRIYTRLFKDQYLLIQIQNSTKRKTKFKALKKRFQQKTKNIYRKEHFK